MGSFACTWIGLWKWKWKGGKWKGGGGTSFKLAPFSLPICPWVYLYVMILSSVWMFTNATAHFESTLMTPVTTHIQFWTLLITMTRQSICVAFQQGSINVPYWIIDEVTHLIHLYFTWSTLTWPYLVSYSIRNTFAEKHGICITFPLSCTLSLARIRHLAM